MEATIPVSLDIARLVGDVFTGPVFFNGAGSSGTPAISFGGDPDTGFFRDASDEIAITLGGSEAIRFVDGVIQLVSDNGLNVSAPGTARLRYNQVAGQVEASLNGAAYAPLGGASPWTKAGTTVSLQVDTDNVSIGSAVALGKLSIDGDTDEIQLLVQAHSTQTSDLVVFEDSAGTDVFKIDVAGNAEFLGQLTVSGGSTTVPGFAFVTGPGLSATASDLFLIFAGSIKHSFDAGQFKCANGTATAPGMSFRGSSAAGFAYVSANIRAVVSSQNIMEFSTARVISSRRLRVADGTAADPGISFTSGTLHGIYFSGSETSFSSDAAYTGGFGGGGSPNRHYMALANGQSATASAAGTAKLVYDDNLKRWRTSIDTGAYQDLVPSGASLWAKTGTTVHLASGTDNVSIGSASALAKLSIDGDTDEIQLLVQGHSTQTSNLVVFEDSTGADLWTISNAGNVYTKGNLEIDGDLNHDGSNIGFFGAAPVAQSAGWTASNVTPDKVFDADATTVDELADVLGTLINYLKSRGDLA